MPAKVLVRVAADVAMVVAVVTAVAVAHKVHVATVVAMAADAVVNTRRRAHKAHAAPKAAMVVAVVKAVAVLLWVTHNRAATKADLAAAWVSALPAQQLAANLIPCAPVSI